MTEKIFGSRNQNEKEKTQLTNAVSQHQETEERSNSFFQKSYDVRIVYKDGRSETVNVPAIF